MSTNSAEKPTTSSTENLRQELQNLQNELPNQTVEVAINTINKMIQKVGTQIQQDEKSGKDTTEFKSYKSKLTSSLDKLTAQNNENKTKKLSEIGVQLSILQNTVTSSAPLQATGIDTEKPQNTKGATAEINKESVNTLAVTTEMIKEFQMVVGSKLQEKMSRRFDTVSLKEGLRIISELGTFQNLPNEIDTKEKEALQKQMPLVNGIIGSLFIGQIFDAGYDIAFNGDNTITMKSKQNFSGTNKSDEFITIINDAIKTNPEIANIMKAGLLYRDQDLLQYAKLRTEYNGTISSKAQESSEFVNFLKTRTNESDSARAILNSQEFFGNNYNLSTEINALQHLKDIPLGSSIQGISEIPTSINVEQNTTSGNNKKGEAYQTGIGALAGTVARTNNSQKKNWDEIGADFTDRPLGTLLRETGNVVGTGLKEIFRDPANFTGALVLLLASRWILGSWKGAFGSLGVLTIGAGMFGRYKEIDNTQDNSSETATQVRIRETLAQVVPQEKINEHHESIHGDNPEIINTIKQFYPENYREITKYLNNEGGEISDNLKTLLLDPYIKKALQKEIDDIDPKFQERLNSAFTDTKDQEEILQNMTYEQAIRFSKMTDEDAIQVAISTLNSLIENTADPQEKQELQAILDQFKQGIPPAKTNGGQPPQGPQTTAGKITQFAWQVVMWGGIIVVSGAAIVGAFKAGKWKERRSMIGKVVNTFTGKGKSSTPSTPNTPNSTSSSTPNNVNSSHAPSEGKKGLFNKEVLPKKFHIPDRSAFSSNSEYKQALKELQYNLTQKLNSRIPSLNSKALQDQLNKVTGLIDNIDNINTQRPFSNKTIASQAENALNEENINAKITELNSLKTITSRNAEQEARLNQLQGEIDVFNTLHGVGYTINNQTIQLTGPEAVRLNTAMQILQNNNGKALYNLNVNLNMINPQSQDTQAIREIQTALEEVNNIIEPKLSTVSGTWNRLKIEDLMENATKQGSLQWKKFNAAKIFAQNTMSVIK